MKEDDKAGKDFWAGGKGVYRVVQDKYSIIKTPNSLDKKNEVRLL